MATTVLNDEHLFLRAIRKELEIQIEKEIEDAVSEIQKKIRGRIGEMAMSLMTHYEFDRSTPNLVITIRNDLKDRTP